MLYFFYGQDADKAREKARGLVEALQKKKPDADVLSMDSDNFSAANFEEFIGGQGLFERKFIVYGNRIFENQEAKVFVMEKLKEIAVSENIFILLEGPV
ncbi:MAG: hypothetical protein Q8P52_01270, partial [bacterium]|nr:hypothetical protein [bacterium]